MNGWMNIKILIKFLFQNKRILPCFTLFPHFFFFSLNDEWPREFFCFENVTFPPFQSLLASIEFLGLFRQKGCADVWWRHPGTFSKCFRQGNVYCEIWNTSLESSSDFDTKSSCFSSGTWRQSAFCDGGFFVMEIASWSDAWWRGYFGYPLLNCKENEELLFRLVKGRTCTIHLQSRCRVVFRRKPQTSPLVLLLVRNSSPFGLLVWAYGVEYRYSFFFCLWRPLYVAVSSWAKKA